MLEPLARSALNFGTIKFCRLNFKFKTKDDARYVALLDLSIAAI